MLCDHFVDAVCTVTYQAVIYPVILFYLIPYIPYYFFHLNPHI